MEFEVKVVCRLKLRSYCQHCRFSHLLGALGTLTRKPQEHSPDLVHNERIWHREIQIKFLELLAGDLLANDSELPVSSWTAEKVSKIRAWLAMSCFGFGDVQDRALTIMENIW